MGKLKIEKTKEERLSEGIQILTQLKGGGVKENGLGYIQLKTKISEWIHTGQSYEDTINFPEHGRIAEISLPKYNNRVAELYFKVKRFY